MNTGKTILKFSYNRGLNNQDEEATNNALNYIIIIALLLIGLKVTMKLSGDWFK